MTESRSRLVALIGGEPDNAAGETFETINPATEDVVAEVGQSTSEQLDRAVAAAATAQGSWTRIAAAERGRRIWRWGDAIVEHGAELAQLDTIDTGKPIADSLSQIPRTSSLCHYWGGMADKIWGHTMPVTPGHHSFTAREPVGVVGVITPWNIPLTSFVGRAAAALACGNGVIMKPSELSPSSALKLAQLAHESGIPAGLLNVLPGDGRVGAMVSSHPDIGGLSFTGSVPTGRAVNVAAASSFKKITLEMGGKTPTIVFADADLDSAVRGALWGVFFNSGQICGAGTRLLLQRDIADRFLDRFLAAARRIRVGDPLDKAVHIGPVVSKTQYERVMSFLEVGRSEAHLVLGGGRPEHVGPRGFYIEPTVFSDADPSMRIAREEIFGPVLTVLTFDTEDEAIALAEGVEYGLGATLWTRDGGRVLRLAEALEVGVVWANTQRLSDPSLTFGGFKQSGLGSASGDGAVEAYTRWKRVSIRFDESAPVPGWDLT
jgi:acyl-CoA reductase-like NAD-dependent aldehyde dehydrogenase